MSSTIDPHWYRKIWTLDILAMSWVEDTAAQVDFLTRILGLASSECILDLACGFGRHSLELARRGHPVTGVDITPAYVDYARQAAEKERLPAEFICADLRDIDFRAEYDVVLNLADGAIGYLENDAENLKIFDRVTAALKPGGRHVMEVCCGDYARKHFPARHWEAGSQALSLAEFDWDAPHRRMIYAGYTFPYGEPLVKPEGAQATSTRLYSLSELPFIYGPRGMQVQAAYAGYQDVRANEDHLEMVVVAVKS